MKKWMALLLAGATALGAVACAKGPAEGQKEQRMVLYENPYRIYVSPQGTDGGDAKSEESPVQSPERAFAVAGALSASELQGHDKIVVTLAPGRYPRRETLTIGADLSAVLPVVVEGAAGGRAVLDAGETYRGGWTEVGDGVYKLPVGKADFRQLYVEGSAAVRARYPNASGDPDLDNMKSRWDETAKKIGVEKFFDADLPAGISGAELHVVQDWTHAIGIVAGKRVVDETLWFDIDAATTASVFGKPVYAPGRRPNQGVWLENRLEFLDAEGEWFHDQGSGDLYYKPARGQDINALTFTVPRVQTLLEIVGSREKKVRGITFSNVDFENTNWTVPSGGYNDLQATQYLVDGSSANYRHPPAGIQLTNTDGILFYDCSIRNMGSTGIDLGIGAVNSKVLACKISQIAGNGISIGYFGEASELTSGTAFGYVPADEREINSGTVIENCEIVGVGKSYRGGTGIAGGYIRNVTIENNEIHDISYSGMGLGWGWEAPMTVMSGFVIRNNRVYDCMNNLTCDGGEIYIMGAHDMSGKLSEISGNYLSAGGNEFGIVYFDTGASFVDCHDNLFEGGGYREGQGTNNGNVTVFFKDDSYGLNIYDNYGSMSGWYCQPVVYPGEPLETIFAKINIRIEEIVVARKAGKWDETASAILARAGIREAYRSVKERA